MLMPFGGVEPSLFAPAWTHQGLYSLPDFSDTMGKACTLDKVGVVAGNSAHKFMRSLHRLIVH